MNKKIIISSLVILLGLVYLVFKPQDRIQYDLPQWESLAKDQITQITYGNSEKVTLSSEGDRWIMGSDGVRVDPAKMRQILTGLEDLHPTDLVSQSGYYGTYELDEEQKVTVEIEATEGSRTFAFGKRSSLGQDTYGLLKDEKGVLILKGDWNRLLPDDAESLRDRSVLAFDNQNIEQFKLINSQDEAKTFVKEGEAWLKEGVESEQKESLDDIMSTLSQLKCLNYTEEQPEGPAEWQITLVDSSGTHSLSLWMKDDNKYLCTSSLAEDPFMISSAPLSGLSDL